MQAERSSVGLWHPGAQPERLTLEMRTLSSPSRGGAVWAPSQTPADLLPCPPSALSEALAAAHTNRFSPVFWASIHRHHCLLVCWGADPKKAVEEMQTELESWLRVGNTRGRI